MNEAIRRKFLIGLIIISIFVFSGCATLLDPWKQAGKIDFEHQSAFIGHVRLEGPDVQSWTVMSYAQNVTTLKIVPIDYWRNGFITKVEPGSYRIHIQKLSKMDSNSYYGSNYSYNSITNSEIPLNYVSQIYTVKSGDAVYIGDFSILLGVPSQLDLKKAATWAGLLAGVSERKIQIGHVLYDSRNEKLSLLQREHPVNDYRFVTNLAQFETGT